MTNYIAIGFAGKRDIDQHAAIDLMLMDIFISFDKSFDYTHFHLTSGLADGADQLATKLFQDPKWRLAKGNSFTTGALIAFSKQDYLETIADKLSFEELYESCNNKVQLDGKYVFGDEGKHFRDKAHRQQGKALVLMSDVIIVVAQENTPSSSLETAMTALQKGVPVIFIDVKNKEKYFLRDLECLLSIDKVGLTGSQIAEALQERYKNQKVADFEQLSETNDERKISFRLRKLLWNWYSGLFKKIVFIHEKIDSSHIDNSFSAAFLRIRKQITSYSRYYQIEYRGGFLWNYALALIAILFAIAGVVINIYLKESSMHKLPVEWEWKNVIIGLGVVKVLIILIMIKNTSSIKNKHYNKKAIDYRYISERLRINYYFSFFGFLKTPNPFLGNHIQNYVNNYDGEVYYNRLVNIADRDCFELAITREKLESIIRFIEEDWFKPQLKYHTLENAKMYHMHNRLEKGAVYLSKAVLVTVCLEIILEIFQKELFLPILMGLSIFLPAFITTMNSLVFQTETKKIAFRSKLIHDQIQSLLLKLRKKAAYIKNHDTDADYEGSQTIEIMEILYKMASITTDEVAEWCLLYEKPVLEQG